MTPEPEQMKRNPFTTPPPEPPPPAPPELFERIDTTPMWNDFVKFIMKYGNHIISAEYPNPPKSHHNLALTYVDTLWQGVPVANGPRARIRHKLEGWVDWEDCIRE
jgi:hypothetical protein